MADPTPPLLGYEPVVRVDVGVGRVEVRRTRGRVGDAVRADVPMFLRGHGPLLIFYFVILLVLPALGVMRPTRMPPNWIMWSLVGMPAIGIGWRSAALHGQRSVLARDGEVRVNTDRSALYTFFLLGNWHGKADDIARFEVEPIRGGGARLDAAPRKSSSWLGKIHPTTLMVAEDAEALAHAAAALNAWLARERSLAPIADVLRAGTERDGAPVP